jgi:hypothetical protein
MNAKMIKNTWMMDGMNIFLKLSPLHAKECFSVTINDLSVKVRTTVPISSRKFHI